MYIFSFKEPQLAQTFVDYMKTKGVMLHIEVDPNGISKIFLADNDAHHLDLVKRELIKYTHNINDERYSNAAWQVGESRNFKVKEHPSNFILPKIQIAGFVTTTITVISIVLYLLSLFSNPIMLLNYFGYPLPYQAGEIWRYLTPIFIHFSLLHILFNLTWWWYLGGMIEKRLGWGKLVEIALISGLLSNYAQASISGPDFGGLSGVIYALMGYVWLYGENIKSTGISLARALIGIAIIWLIAGYTGILGAIANTAHLVGLIIGLILAAKDVWLIKKLPHK